MNMHGTYAGCAKKLHYNTLRLKQNTILLSRPYIQLARSNNTRQHTHTKLHKGRREYREPRKIPMDDSVDDDLD